MEFKITIKELLAREFCIEADSREEARRAVREMYEKGEVVLDWEDYESTEIE